MAPTPRWRSPTSARSRATRAARSTSASRAKRCATSTTCASSTSPGSSIPDATAFAELKRPDFPNATLDRLYALGIDAFRVAQAFADGPPAKFEFDGATGHLSLDATRQFVREGRLMQFAAGQHRAGRPALTWPSPRGAPVLARRGTGRRRSSSARGLTIVARNFRRRRGEIDLIARDGDTLVFVEVRLRSRRDFGGAAASITAAKRARIAAAARFYLARLRHTPPCRFDAMLLDALDADRIEWLRDIMTPERASLPNRRSRASDGKAPAPVRSRAMAGNANLATIARSDSRPWIMSRAFAPISPTARN